MFSATKFVVAAVIVALFGGFLLAGVLTQQGEEPLPAVGASASPEASPLYRVRLPDVLPDDVRSGTLDTPLGPARWVHLQVGWGGRPWGPRPLPAPDGFLLLDDDGPTLWRSPDLIEWTLEPRTIEATYQGLVLADGTYWLNTSDPDGLWRSKDTVTWQQIDLSELVLPFPERLVRGPDLGDPVSSAGVTIVSFRFESDVTGLDLGLPDLDQMDWRLFASAEPGVYEATRTKVTRKMEVHARLRFEETDTGLRVIDADDGTELAELDGVGLEFIEDFAAGGHPGVSGYAIVEGDGLVPVDGPWPPGQLPGLLDQDHRVFGTESGFVVFRYAPDSDLVQVWHSGDGVTWAKTEPLGDDPGEPTRLYDMRLDGQNEELEAVGGGSAWLSSDGVIWRESGRPPREGAVRMGSGWLSLSKDELSFKRDDDDGWATTDVTELDIDIGMALGEDGIVGSGVDVYAISPDTIVVPAWHEIWILTFDDLPG